MGPLEYVLTEAVAFTPVLLLELLLLELDLPVLLLLLFDELLLEDLLLLLEDEELEEDATVTPPPAGAGGLLVRNEPRTASSFGSCCAIAVVAKPDKSIESIKGTNFLNRMNFTPRIILPVAI